MEYLFLLGRILLGGFFLRSGFNHFRYLDTMTGYAASKGLPMPKVATAVTGVMLLFGGAGIVSGAWVQCTVGVLSIFLVGTTFKMHDYWNVADPMQRMGESVNFYKNLGLLGAVLILLAVPPEVWAWPFLG